MELNLIEAVLLGLVQGLTEFLPVSSSGHLVLGERLLNVHLEDNAFNVFLHFGTLLAVLLYFRREIREILAGMLNAVVSRRNPGGLRSNRPAMLGIYILVGSVPAAFVGIGLKGPIEEAFSNVTFASLMLLVTAAILLSTRFVRSGREPLGMGKSLLIGASQAAAILPGISRSGSTIATGMFLGLDRNEAANFSFLLSLPAVAGAAVIKLGDVAGTELGLEQSLVYLAGTVVAAVTGYLSIAVLLRLIKRGSFSRFGYYCLLLGLFGLIFLR